MKGKQILLISIIFAGIFFSTISLGRQILLLRKEQETFMHLRMQIADLREGSNSLNGREERERDFYEIKNKEDCVEEDILPEFKEIFIENSDFCGWITIEGTNIDYPVMQKAEDREYYLHRDFYGKESYGGVPFVGNHILS